MIRAGLALSVFLFLPGLVGRAAGELLWTEGAGFRSRELHPGTGGQPGFTLISPQNSGVWFTNQLQGDAYLTNAVAHNGAGLAIGDVDGDGWPDIYFCNLQGPNRLYRNLGQWRFEDIDVGGAACAEELSTGATFVDADGDGDLDLLVNGVARGTRLFLNDGKARWTEKKDSGLSRTASATSMALADIDGDGDLDLYCAHYIDVMHLADPTTRIGMARRDGQWVVTKVNDESTRLPRWQERFEALPDGRVRELPEVHGLYRNDGTGRFTPIQFQPGTFSNEAGNPIPPYRDWGLAVMFRDLNRDGAPDIYVCNDNASPDRVWINSGRGTFRAIEASKFRHTSRSSMGMDFADLDRDGYDDLIVLDMLARDHGKRMAQLVRDLPDPQERERIDAQPRYNRNMLFFGRPDGSYAEAALMGGVAATDWSWCPIFIDVDLDGYEDLLVTTGFSFDVMDRDSHDQLRTRKLTREQLKRSRQFHPHWPTPNAAFRNRGDGTFEPMAGKWGFDQTGISNGMAVGDLDNDGDLDVVINNLNGAAGLFRNESSAGRIAVRLKGRPPNTRGIGARVRLVGGSVTQSQEMICGGRYMSGDQALRVFAATADSPKPMRLEVRWRSGHQSILTNLQANRVYEVDQAQSEAPTAVITAAPVEPFFADASARLGHRHIEDSFDDWARQPLLPRRLSRLGPGVGWFDLDGDGWEDLAIASGRGGKLAIFRNELGESFRKLEGISPSATDQGAVVGWIDGRGQRSLLVAASNDGMLSGRESEVAVYSMTNLASPQRWPAGPASLGPMAVADIDGDGDLDVFLGGRSLPGRYPEPVSSAFWLNEGGELRPSSALSEPFKSLGLVSGAVFGDLDGDNDPELALAMEWGPVRVFRNQKGRFEEMTEPWGFSSLTGWWTSITMGDFDGDGRLDLAAGNRGRNTLFEMHRPAVWRAFYGDWNGDGTLEVIEAWRRGLDWLPVRDRFWLTRGLPELPNRFPTHQAFGGATVQDILGSSYVDARYVQAAYLDAAVFLNRGSHFEATPLPREAQMAPVFGINVGDFNGDGMEDLFLSQNCFGTPSDLTRDDGGRGLWLQGDGVGTFRALEASITGIRIDGEQRGAALADFNHDGRVDVAVSQNDAPTKLYVNRLAKRGLRVVLKGSNLNPEAIGAQMRVRYASGSKGPIRAVQAGSGYWSQDGTVQVLGLRESPVALWVRWPGGKEQTVPVSEEDGEIRLELKP